MFDFRVEDLNLFLDSTYDTFLKCCFNSTTVIHIIVILNFEKYSEKISNG